MHLFFLNPIKSFNFSRLCIGISLRVIKFG